MFAERDARSGIDTYGDAWRNLNDGALALAHGDRDAASRLFELGKQKLAELGVALDPDDQSEVDWMTRQLAE